MTKKNASPPDFETALAELGEIVRQMEDGQAPLEQSLLMYRRGTELLKFCQESLRQAEQQVLILNEQNQLQSFSTEND